MKIMILNRHAGESLTLPPEIELAADSSLTIAGRPLFVPDDMTAAWSARLYFAARLSRLGKSVKSRFAMRYVDGMGLAMRLVPDEIDLSLRSRRADRGVTLLFDGAISTGKWLAPITDESASITISATGLDPISLTMKDAAVAESIEAVSRHATIKTGDLLLCCRLPLRMSVGAGSTVRAAIDGEECLNVRLK